VPDAAAQWTVAAPGDMEWYKWTENKSIGTPATSTPALVAGPCGIQAWAALKEDHVKITVPFTTPAPVYTMLWDIRVSGLSGYHVLLQTHGNNGNDGEVFIKNKTIGAGGYSSDVFTEDTWHRVVVSVDGTSSMIVFYVDGRKVVDKTYESRYSLDAIFWLFLDENNEDNAQDCARFAIWNVALSNEQVAALGGAGVPVQ
jgi:hypothetical protein